MVFVGESKAIKNGNIKWHQDNAQVRCYTQKVQHYNVLMSEYPYIMVIGTCATVEKL